MTKHLEETIKAMIKEIESPDVAVRDEAVEALSDILADENTSTELLQIVINELGRLLQYEKSDLVIESILNALSNAKYSGHDLCFPISIITEQLSGYKGTALEHAKYILDDI